MEKDGGFEIFRQAQGEKPADRTARSQSKTSFSVPSPKLSGRAGPWSPRSPQRASSAAELQEIDDLNLDEPAPAPPHPPQTSNTKNLEEKAEENDFPDFDVVDKGVEIEVKEKDRGEEEDEEHSDNFSDKGTVSSEVVKEVVQDPYHVNRLSELDSIALQIKALESMMGEDKVEAEKNDEEEAPAQLLDADEDKVTREFLQLLEDDVQDFEFKSLNPGDGLALKMSGSNEEGETEAFLSDLGKGLGSIVQTGNRGFLAAMNPLDTPVARKDTPKLAMQLSKPMVIRSEKVSGFELFQKIAAVGLQELTSGILSVMPMDELMGKTAEQIAFEGIASAIILGRNKEGASSSAARTVGALKSMANAMNVGRKDRISSGIWNVGEDPLTVDEILPFSIQKIESMAMEALKIQADATEEEAPFDVSPGKASDNMFTSAVPVDDWANENKNKAAEAITVAVVIQLRDPLRQYEAVGGPMLALIQVSAAVGEKAEEANKYKVGSLQVGGVKVRNPGKSNSWDGEKQELTALQWLVAHGLAKACSKKGKRPPAKGSDVLWSLTARVMADMWLTPIRNPDVKLT